MSKKLLLLSTAVGMILTMNIAAAGPIHPVRSASHHPTKVKTFIPSARFSRSHQVPGKAKELSHESLYENWFNTTYAITTSAGFAPLDRPTSINCKSSNGCTLVVESMAQVFPFAEAQASINPEVDGELLNLAGALTDISNINGFTFLNTRANLSISPGKHTVQTYLYVGYTYYSGDWQIDYSVWSK